MALFKLLLEDYGQLLVLQAKTRVHIMVKTTWSLKTLVPGTVVPFLCDSQGHMEGVVSHQGDIGIHCETYTQILQSSNEERLLDNVVT